MGMDIPIISTVMASLAKAGIPNQVLTSRAAIKLRRTPPEEYDVASTQVLIALTMAFAKVQAVDQSLFDSFGDAFLRRSPVLFQTGSCDMLVNIFHAFTKVHAVHEPLYR